jgi:Flp pilus assembly protein TadB
VGCLLVVFVAGSLLLGFLWIRASSTEAMKQRKIAEAEHQRSIEQSRAAESRAAQARERFDTVQQKVDLAQQQLDETRRTCEDAVTRTDGRLTVEDRDRIDRAFTELQERLKQLDEVFH